MGSSDRRVDSEQAEIEKLIAAEDDTKVRLTLMVMNRINLSLIANTETINDVAKQLDEHITKFETRTASDDALVNQGRGAWKVAAWVFGVVQAVTLAVWVESRSEVKDTRAAIAADRIEHVILSERIKAVEVMVK